VANTPIKITTHSADALLRLLAQFEDKPSIRALVSALVGPVQNLEDTLYQLLSERGINSAVGAQLDLLGRIVGVARGALSDASYHTRVEAQILINISSGAPDEVLAVFELLDPANTFELEENYPAEYIVHALAPATPPVTNADFVLINQMIHPAAVGTQFNYLVAPLAETFTMSTSAALEFSTTQGFGDDGNPATGGQFSGVG
jgi:hypothetical protein